MMQQNVLKIDSLLLRSRQFRKIALGGTFDNFHKGHEYLINAALGLSKQLVIGITSDVLSSALHPLKKLENYHKRKKNVINYLNKVNRKAKIVKLNDIYGTTIVDEAIEAVILTKSTLSGGIAINKKRISQGKKGLILIYLDLLKAEDDEPISSTRIRDGIINRKGKSYFNYLNNQLPLIVTEKIHHYFKKPFGKIFSSKRQFQINTMKKAIDWATRNNLEPIITVGDVVTHNALKLKAKLHLHIIDFHVQRVKKYMNSNEIGPIKHLKHYKIINKPGTISESLVKSINAALKSKQASVIQVQGEEDLAVLPVTLLCPLNGVIFYGHYQHGVIGVKVSEKKKKEALNIVENIKRLNE
jgi:pantetheine-phosphate adenylyltransferase